VGEKEWFALSTKKHFVVLMVDDDDDDWLLVKEAFAESQFTCDFELDLRRLKDGLELVDYLDKCISGADQKGPLPNLILLDLNMPGMHGKEALKWVKSHPTCRGIPVVIFTASTEKADAVECYQYGSSSFLEKPRSYDSLKEMIQTLCDYWACILQLPNS
jgi:CheY-like chemotaxis protein